MTQPEQPEGIEPERLDKFRYDDEEGIVFFDQDGDVMPPPTTPTEDVGGGIEAPEPTS